MGQKAPGGQTPEHDGRDCSRTSRLSPKLDAGHASRAFAGWWHSRKAAPPGQAAPPRCSSERRRHTARDTPCTKTPRRSSGRAARAARSSRMPRR
eukprot:7384692-Prymnesium_polylepis.1